MIKCYMKFWYLDNNIKEKIGYLKAKNVENTYRILSGGELILWLKHMAKINGHYFY